MRAFGVEVEVGGGTADMLHHLGLDGLHCYHCGCSRCDPFRTGPDWTGQEDCTSDGEFVSRVLHYGEDGTHALNKMGEALRLARAVHSDGEQSCYSSSVQGVHVHVGAEDVLDDNMAMLRLWRLWFTHEDEMADIAAGSYGGVRDYNPRVRLGSIVRGDRLDDFWSDSPGESMPMLGGDFGRGWLNTHTGHGTVEFRLWNATRATWRLHLYAGLSVALVHLAAEGVLAHPDDGVSLFDRVHHLLTSEATAAYLRHLYGKELAA